MIIGLTGGVASGKSTVGALFQTLGAEVIDADQVAREVVVPGTAAYQHIVAHFGPRVVGEAGHINRRALRDIVFADAIERQWLEALLHPLIRQELNQRAHLSRTPYCVLMIPLLTERSHYPKLSRILVIDTPSQLQLNRVQARDKISTEQAEAILSAQSSRETRLAMADDVIVNDGDLFHLTEQVKALHQRYLAYAGA